jgi:anti-sigma regulatory factor (Ser/Thr protein kinase)
MEELALHILDIVQNSIEAGATRIKLSIVEDYLSDRLTIRISDNGRGMTQAERKKVLNPFYTTRKTRRVGLGLPLLAAAAEACAGSLQIESKRGMGTTIVADFQHSHIDRAPIGDLPRTFVSIIAMLGPGNLIYSHRTVDNGGERDFGFDTFEIRERIGEVPLNHPGVSRWLLEYFREGEQGLAQTNQGV